MLHRLLQSIRTRDASSDDTRSKSSSADDRLKDLSCGSLLADHDNASRPDHDYHNNTYLTNSDSGSSLHGGKKRQMPEVELQVPDGYPAENKMPAAEEAGLKDFCNVSESPYYLLQLAARGKILELERRIMADKSELLVKDRNGRGLVHHAAKSGHISTLDFLLSHEADVNSRDSDGNTPLHVAVENKQKFSVSFLLVHGADPTILNERQMAPIHMAVDLNNKEILEELLSHDCVDPNLTGENGATSLHYTAWKDYPECARILLKHHAKMCMPCDIGLTPMHIAAQNSSSATLEVLIEFAEKKGCGQRVELLTKLTNEKNTPLHAAISGGNLQIVKMCLMGGAQIDAKQENGSTPVHLAAAQGSLEMIRLMFEMQPQKKMTCLLSKDNIGNTPLHMAAMLDRTQTVEYLIQQGAEIDSKSDDGRTSLLLAASKSAWSSAIFLINAKADINVRDPENRNILHLIIRGGGQPTSFENCLAKVSLTKLLNEQDQFGCSPLHYASKQGQLKVIEKLLQLGAHLNAKNNKKQSALHFAAKYGRYNTCQRLISSTHGTNIVNEADGSGQTALHAAASNGHIQVVRLLLQNGAGIFKDVNGNTALHLAASNGHTHTITTILNVHHCLIDSFNKNKDTCLHLATQEGHSNVVTLLLDMGAKILLNKDLLHLLDLGIKQGKKDVCVAIISHDRWKEAMKMRSTLYGCPMVGMIQYMPEVCQMILDRCRIPSGQDRKHKDFHYTYDFKFMQVDLDLLRKLQKNGVDILPLFALNMMVKFNRVECLSHPVCAEFLRMKWCSYGVWFHMVNLLVYFAYVCCLSIFVITYDYPRHHQSPNNSSLPSKSDFNSTESPFRNLSYSTLDDNSTDNLTFSDEVEQEEVLQKSAKLTDWQQFLAVTILVFCVVNACKEVIQMIQQKWKYVKESNNRVEWVLYVTTAIFIGPFIFNTSVPYQWECGAVAVYLAWFNYLLFFQRFNSTGIYVVMFLEILHTLVHVMIIFSVLIFAFGLCFFVLLNTGTSPGFSSPHISLMSTVIMMLGNIDYRDVWVIPFSTSELPHSSMAFFMLFLFILFIPILLVNLLIGLAVGDIEAVQKNARLKRIAMQVQLHTELEQNLPKRLLKLVDKPTLNVYPNRLCSLWERTKGRLLLEKRESDHHTETATLTGGSKELPDDSSVIEYNSHIYSELNNQKLRMKQISLDMKKHYDLLRLIVQKMEIHTEADDVDEDCSLVTNVQNQRSPDGAGIGWSSAALRHTMMKQALVISKWKKSETD